MEICASAVDAVDRKRTREAADAMYTSDESPEVRETRSSESDPRMAFVLGRHAVKGRARWRGPRMKGKWSAADGSPSEGVGAPISAWTADHWNCCPRKNAIMRRRVAHGRAVKKARGAGLNRFRP